MAEHALAERYACKLLEVDRSTYRYEPRPDRNAQLREALLMLAKQQPRYGYRRLWALLVRQGWEVDVKRIHRLYKAEGLMVRRLKRKRLSRPVSANPPLVQQGETRNGPWTSFPTRWRPGERSGPLHADPTVTRKSRWRSK